MTLVFIVWAGDSPYAGFPDVVECAQRRADCPIWVISDRPAPGRVNYAAMSEFPAGDEIRKKYSGHTAPWLAMSLARWFVLRDFIRKYKPSFPIFCADWDVMIFRDLEEAYSPFADCDYTVSMLGDIDSAAYGVNRLEPLEAFCDLVEKMADDNDPRAEMLDDMFAWQLNRGTGNWKVGNLFETHGASVFDHNIHCGDGRFVMAGPAKKVTFREGTPYFTGLDGAPTLANTIHCWGTYKTRTSELLRKTRPRRLLEPSTWL